MLSGCNSKAIFNMKKPYTKKEIVYYVDSEEKAKQLRSDLYETYEDVAIYFNGKEECRVVVCL